MSELKRFGVSIEENLLKKFDEINDESYNNRSEAIRDLIRNKIIEEEIPSGLDNIIFSGLPIPSKCSCPTNSSRVSGLNL